MTHFTWQCAMRYHNQCISPGNVLCGTTTSVFQLAMCYAVPQPMYFTWQCAMRYQNQCISPGNVLCGTWYHITHFQMKYTGCGTVSHIARMHWSWCSMTHCQVKGTGRGTHSTLFHLKMCHAVPQPVYFSWQCVMRYHSLCISPGNVLCGTRTSVFHLAMCHAAPQPMYCSWQCIHCQVKYTGCDTVWHTTRWNTLIVVQ
jgi:hypothetical protein